MTIAGELISSVVAGIASAGLRKGFAHARLVSNRTKRIDRALSDKTSKSDRRLAKAIHDLEVVLGSQHGALTEPVAAMLREVEKSAIPDSIIRCVLANQNPSPILPAFQSIYSQYSQHVSFSGEEFFNALYEAIRVRTESDVKDTALLEYVQAQNTALGSQIASILRALELAKDLPAVTFDILDARVKLAKAIETANRDLTVDTLNGAKRFKIGSLVIAPRVVPAVAGDQSRKASPYTEESDTIKFVAFKQSVRRSVILGDPGGGKSTMTQLLCYENAKSIRLEANNAGSAHIDPAELKLPLRIILRGYEKSRVQNAGYSFVDYLVDAYKDVFENDAILTAEVIRRFLVLGQCVIIFDGLDELLELETRRSIVSAIEQFTMVYAACPVVITSRFVGYRDAPLSDDFDLFNLASLSQAEVLEFAKKLIKAVEGGKQSDADERAARFVSQTDSTAADLRENPLMLGLMVHIFIYRGDVPDNRPEIYKECATLMFEKWDQRRNIIFSTPADFDLLDVFSHLASRIFGTAETEEGVSKDWLLRAAREFFDVWYLDQAKALATSRRLVEFITGRAWVMYDVGPNVYKFTHRTFLEYFFARHLISSSASVRELIESRLLNKILNSEWDVISHLALQTAVFRDSGKMAQAADTLEGLIEANQSSAREMSALLAFVARAMAYLVLPERRYARLTEILCLRIVELGAAPEHSVLQVLYLLMASSRRREAVAKPAICGVLRSVLSGPDTAGRAFVMVATALHQEDGGERRLRMGYHYHSVVLGAPWTSAYFKDLRNEMEPVSRRLAMERAHCARLYMYSYKTRINEFFNIFGLHAFFASADFSVINVLPDLLLSNSDTFASQSRTKDAKSGFLDLIADKVVAGVRLPSPRMNAQSNSEYNEQADFFIHYVYSNAVDRQRTPRNVDKTAKALLAICISIEYHEPIQIKKRYGEKRGRLSMFIPNDPLRQVLSTIAGHPLEQILRDWEAEKVSLLKFD